MVRIWTLILIQILYGSKSNLKLEPDIVFKSESEFEILFAFESGSEIDLSMFSPAWDQFSAIEISSPSFLLLAHQAAILTKEQLYQRWKQSMSQ